MNCGFPGLHLPVAPLLAGDTAKVLAALTGHEPLNGKPPETSVNSDTCSAHRRAAPLLAHCLAGLQMSANRPSALRQNGQKAGRNCLLPPSARSDKIGVQ
jgi:hypothetical protein